MEIFHKPVLVEEVLDLLQLRQTDIVVDGTIGEGGHSAEFLKIVGYKGFLIGIDLDEEVIQKAKDRLKKISNRFKLVYGNFKDLDLLLGSDFPKVDKIFLDLGVSSFELELPKKGFSFQTDSPLDLRMDKNNPLMAKDVVNNFSEMDLADIIYNYGEERYSRRISKMIVEERKRNKIESTLQLANICKRAYPAGYHRINPATRTFQALRIFVNDELNNLKTFLLKIPIVLNPKGRIAIISYHSLEDRIVKSFFKESQNLVLLTKKPVIPSKEEIEKNRRSRSAKLRVAEMK